jgi:hypothetical protein
MVAIRPYGTAIVAFTKICLSDIQTLASHLAPIARHPISNIRRERQCVTAPQDWKDGIKRTNCEPGFVGHIRNVQAR